MSRPKWMDAPIPERGACMTYEQIAEAFGITRERVRQVEMQAVRKLRIAIRALGKDESQAFEEYLLDLLTGRNQLKGR